MSSSYYFINRAGQQVGPVEKEKLLQYGVTRNTPVWTEGMAAWAPAGTIPELDALFNAVPPVNGGYMYENPYGFQQKPPSYLWLAILSTLLCCLPFGIVSIVYAAKVDDRWAMGDHQGAYRNSQKAKMWGIASVVSVPILLVFYLVLIFCFPFALFNI